MANKLADARRSLVRAKESALERLRELENERREIKASLKTLDAALKALGRTDRTANSRQPQAVQAEPTDVISDDL